MGAELAGRPEPVASVPPVEPLRVSPALAAGQFNTLREPLVPRASFILEDIKFAFDSSFLLPEAAEDFAIIAALRNDNPGSPLALFAHADPTGNDDYNKTLSGRRAIAVFGALTRRVDLWEKLFSAPFGNDKWGDPAIATMREATAPGSPASTTPPAKAERGELFKRYMDFLCRDLAKQSFTLDDKKDFLARGVDSGGKGDFQGCGEFNPVMVLSKSEQAQFEKEKDKTARDEANAPNRRVAGIFFEAGAQIDPKRWPCPRATEGPTDCRKRFFSDSEKRKAPGAERRLQDVDGETFRCRFYDRFMHGEGRAVAARIQFISLRLIDIDDKPRAAVPFELTVSGTTFKGVTDSEGRLRARVPSTAKEATLVVDQTDRTPRTEMTVTIEPLAPVTTVLGVQTRLAHLGYFGEPVDGVLGPGTRESLRWFQRDRNEARDSLPENGSLADVPTQNALVKAHGS